MSGKRICVIGAGPSGMSALYQFTKIEGMPEIVCYEKQKTWGGQWNPTWRTGLDEHGENCHSSIYRNLWINAPKESNIEFPDYTFQEHFGQPVPSYLPATVVRDYLEGRWTKGTKQDLKKLIKFNTVVKFVRYQDDKDNFVVTIDDVGKGKTCDEVFSHVVVCTGIFNFPNTPEFPGIDRFRGRILHSHDYRNAGEFKGQRLLIIGSSYSGTDIAVNCMKFGAKHIIISYRESATGSPWQNGIEERLLVTNFDDRHAYFKDGSFSEIDAVIFCTGYKTHFPFMENRLRIGEETSFYQQELYKASLFTKEGNNKLFYIGVQNQLYTFTYFDILATWIGKYIMSQLPEEPISRAKMEADIDVWFRRSSELKHTDEVAGFQADILKDLIGRSGDGYSRDVLSAVALFKDWAKHRTEGIENYRNHRFRSLYTGTLAPKQRPYMEAFDDSKEACLEYK